MFFLLFGWRSSTLKKAATHEVHGDNAPPGIYLYQQRYFHLFYIPFFGLGKHWTLHAADGKYYTVNTEVVDRLKPFAKGIRTPVWVYLTPLLLLIFAAVYGGMILLISSDIDASNKKDNNERKARVLERIAAPRPGDVYRMRVSTMGDTWSTQPSFRVVEASNHLLVFEASDDVRDSAAPFSGKEYYRECDLFAPFSDTLPRILVTIPDSVLREAYEFFAYNEQTLPGKPEGVPFVYKDKTYYLQVYKVFRAGRGFFNGDYMNTGFNLYNNTYSASLKWNGEPVIIDSAIFPNDRFYLKPYENTRLALPLRLECGTSVYATCPSFNSNNCTITFYMHYEKDSVKLKYEFQDQRGKNATKMFQNDREVFKDE